MNRRIFILAPIACAVVASLPIKAAPKLQAKFICDLCGVKMYLPLIHCESGLQLCRYCVEASNRWAMKRRLFVAWNEEAAKRNAPAGWMTCGYYTVMSGRQFDIIAIEPDPAWPRGFVRVDFMDWVRSTLRTRLDPDGYLISTNLDLWNPSLS